MKHFVKRMLAAALTLTLTVSLSAGALAYNRPDFEDVPTSHWAYDYVMGMADTGIIKGTSDTTFSPDTKISAAMWVTLMGRILFEDEAQAAAQDGDMWYSAYVRVAQEKYYLSRAGISIDAIEDEITRYEMASMLYVAHRLIGVNPNLTILTPTWTKYSAEISGYQEMPIEYQTGVMFVYSQGLIKGDENGNFNGDTTMTRAEAATVIARLLELKGQAETGTLPPIEPATPRTGETETFTIKGYTFRYGDTSSSNIEDWEVRIPNATVILYYIDGRELGRTTSDADGNYIITVTVDRADYSMTESCYYINAYGVDPETGIKYYDDSTATANLYSLQRWKNASSSMRSD